MNLLHTPKVLLNINPDHLLSFYLFTIALQGANRPPGTRLAVAHEAVLAVKCLECLATHSAVAKEMLINNNNSALLEGARSVGASTHEILFREASRVYDKWTEEERSC
jgi:hypothetical protein